ncbi:unnamed protein product [Toxocara canis]|uniref:ANKLE2 third alpha/beta domain-containing protein n=1 Tax=Toxocara canis TaxID=6265 RepID=A0A3P7HAA4_TOXCA|nr:unnamed protein product [Toxocara canis]
MLDSYLNTPDKGALETPLHFASKFGHYEIVRMLLELTQCERNPKNKNGELPVDVCCSRASAENKKNQSAILALFSPVYVPLYRPEDCSTAAIIKPPGYYPPKAVPGVGSPFASAYVLAAVAGPFMSGEDAARFRKEWIAAEREARLRDPLKGPFMSGEDAARFRKEWIAAEREARLRDPLKGDERIGRALAHQYGVRWMERWRFYNDVIDLNSAGGLEKLNAYLVRNMLVSSREDTSARKKLVFDEDDEEQQPVDDDQFEDSFEVLPPLHPQTPSVSQETSLSDSLGSFISR